MTLRFPLIFLSFFLSMTAFAWPPPPLPRPFSYSQHFCFQLTNRTTAPINIISDNPNFTVSKPEISSGDIGNICIYLIVDGTVTNGDISRHIRNNGGSSSSDSTFGICSGSQISSTECNLNNKNLSTFSISNKSPERNNHISFDTTFQNLSLPNPPIQSSKNFARILNFTAEHKDIVSCDDCTTSIGNFNFSEMPGQNNSVIFLNSLDSGPLMDIYYNDKDKKYPISVNENYNFSFYSQSSSWFLSATASPMGPLASSPNYDLTFNLTRKFFGEDFSNSDSGANALTVTPKTKYVALFPDFFNHKIQVESSDQNLPQGFYELSYQMNYVDSKNRGSRELFYSDGTGNICSLTHVKNGLQYYHDMGGGYNGTQNFNDNIGLFRLVAGNEKPPENNFPLEIYRAEFQNKIFPDCSPANVTMRKTDKTFSTHLKNPRTLSTSTSSVENGIYSDENGILYKVTTSNQFCTYQTLYDFYTDHSLPPGERTLGHYKSISSSQIKSLQNMGHCLNTTNKATTLGQTPFLGQGNYLIQISIPDIYPNCQAISKNLSLYFTYYDTKYPNFTYPISKTYSAPNSFSEFIMIANENSPNFENFIPLNFHTNSDRNDPTNANMLGTPIVEISQKDLVNMCQNHQSLWIRKQLYMYDSFLSLL